MAGKLVKVLVEEEQHTWTAEEIDDQLSKGIFNSRFTKQPTSATTSSIQNPANQQQPPAAPQQLPAAAQQLPAVPQQLPAAPQQLPPAPQQLPPAPQQLPTGTHVWQYPQYPPNDARFQQQYWHQNRQQQNPQQLPGFTTRPEQLPNPPQHPDFPPPPLHPPQHPDFLPLPRHPPLIVGNGRELGNLLKIYSDDMKYSGGNDSLNLKLHIFYDLCRKASVPTESFGDAFSTMLKGKAQEYYYDKISGQRLDFTTMVKLIQNHFETLECCQQMLTTWNTISLQSVIQKNNDKTIGKCFELLVTKLRKVQRGLAEEYQTENTLHDHLLNACRGVQECVYACFKPALTFEALCAEIRSSIATASRVAENKTQKSSFYNNSEMTDQFYTDRRYHSGSRFQQSN